MIKSNDNFILNKAKLEKDLRSSLRKLAIRDWPAKTAVLKRSERIEFKLKKDGTVGRVKLCFYKCALCGSHDFKRNEVEVDHINPAGRFEVEKVALYIKRLFCGESNLQVICKEVCHRAKTKSDRIIIKRRGYL